MASRYLTTEGIEWLADRNERNWRTPNGDVCLARIAQDAGIGRAHLYRLIGGDGVGLKVMDALINLAVSTGSSRTRAEKQMFIRADQASASAEQPAEVAA
jgi:hypothetical protein